MCRSLTVAGVRLIGYKTSKPLTQQRSRSIGRSLIIHQRLTTLLTDTELTTDIVKTKTQCLKSCLRGLHALILFLVMMMNKLMEGTGVKQYRILDKSPGSPSRSTSTASPSPSPSSPPRTPRPLPSASFVTETVFGFLDFVTTVGDTVMVFTPANAGEKHKKRAKTDQKEPQRPSNPPWISRGGPRHLQV